MVARINTGKSISKALNYNEKKVQENQAELLLAHAFIKEKDQLTFYDKLHSFEKLTSLNEKTTTNTLHVSLNFDPSEELDNEKLIEIAEDYMKRIGFEDQPYLVYRHYDTQHPHIHIVSTNVQLDGSRISMHNMGRNQSEDARKEIEIAFGLVKAESKKITDTLKLKPLNAQKLNPGKRATKAAISNVLGIVIPQYKYASLAELNAVLKLYNVMADRCSESSDTFRNKGLLFRVLDDKGNKVGTPIKASLFYMKPALSFLEERFIQNKDLKKPHSQRLKTAIDYAFLNRPSITIHELKDQLNREQISIVIRENKDGFIYGITFVDHRTKCVFNGSDLGKGYSAKMILEKCEQKKEKPAPSVAVEKKKFTAQEIHPKKIVLSNDEQSSNNLLELLIRPEMEINYIPYAFRKPKRKRKKKKLII